tara:strand:+ start:1534 stop:1848 length:315 start_codon:yes stop_codon:yes gene_type:complete
MTIKMYKKLVRDRIPEIIEESGKRYNCHVADEDEFRGALLQKLVEEVEEFIEDPSIEELADIYEVLDALRKEFRLHGSMAQQIVKRIEKGSFENRYILDWAEKE